MPATRDKTSSVHPIYNVKGKVCCAARLKNISTMNEIVLKNPITNRIQNSINLSENKLNFAVPFLSSFAISVMNDKNTKHIIDKRLVTRFDDSSISSFDIPTLKTFLDFGFNIHIDNNIHLKLYITDNETFVTSSNFTKGGFENNIELTIKVDSENAKNCIDIFNEIWENAKGIKVTYELLTANLPKYELLKKRQEFANRKTKTSVTTSTTIGQIDIQQVISEIFNQKKDYSKISSLAFEANILREKVKNKLKIGFSTEIFYAPEGHPNRRNNLFYDFTYGYEVDLAGTGLRELQFKTVFEHKEFRNVIAYIFPEMIGMKPWNLEDKNELLEFCNGIFEFNIPQYSEAIPIRLVSYFYPDYFIPIFKLEHLKKVCEALDIDTNAKTKGDRLFAYNSFIADKMKPLPFDNYIKSNIAYHLLYTVELHNRLINGESYENILSDYKEMWKRGFIVDGRKLLIKLNIIK